MSESEVPEGRCGFVLEPEDIPDHAQDARIPRVGIANREVQFLDAGSDEWYKGTGAVCCWRPVWDGTDEDRCIWHAQTDDKSADGLTKARADEPERLDGAYIPPVELDDDIDFEGCRLWAASFEGTRLRQTSFEEVEGLFVKMSNADLWGAEFRGANLLNARFHKINLFSTNFTDSDLRWSQFPRSHLVTAQFLRTNLRSTQFSYATLRGVQFPETELVGTQFPNADLTNADFSDRDATHATFTDATLKRATFTGAILSDVDFTDARLHDTHLRDIHINARTKVSNVVPEEADADWFAATDLSPLNRIRWWLTWWRADPDALSVPLDQLNHYDQLDRAHTVYRTIQRLYRENSMPEKIDEYHVRAKDVRRKQAIIDSDWLRWLYLAGQRWVMRYGERPRRVVGTSLGVILVSALLYPLVGGINRPPLPDGTTRVAFDAVPLVPFGVPEPVATVLTSLYFSVVTFTTLGYGDLQPATGVAQAVATVESLVGALLMALLVYVLGRRATR